MKKEKIFLPECGVNASFEITELLDELEKRKTNFIIIGAMKATLKTHTKPHNKKRRKVRKSKNAKMGHHTDLPPKICPNGHNSRTKTNNGFKSKKNNRPSQNSSTKHTPDRIRPSSRLQGPLQNCYRPPPDGILFPSPPIPTDHNSRMCSQKHFLHTSQDVKTKDRTKMGPNSRLEAIRDTQNDILDSGKEEEYEATLFDDSEVEEAACSMKATTHSATLIASLMVSTYTNYIGLQKDSSLPLYIPFSIKYNIPLMTVEC
jgi:hypothetical protein